MPRPSSEAFEEGFWMGFLFVISAVGGGVAAGALVVWVFA
jgi:hypothetical protein